MKVFNLLRNLWQRAKSYSDSNLQISKDYTDSNSISAIHISGMLTNIGADGSGNITVSYTVPTGYTQIGALVCPTYGLNRFHVWAGDFPTSNSLRVLYWNNRTSTATTAFDGLVFIKKVGG